MKKPRAAAIYARISSDAEGFGYGVARQLADCRALAARLGWHVAQEYVDNDVSAYSGKLRPAFQQMLVDIRDGQRDGVVVYHMDRLTRLPIELEHFLAAVKATNLTDVRFVTGDMDLGTGDGLLVARIQAATAANSSAGLSRRIKRKLDEIAAAGKPHGGYQRPFGYEPDKVTVRESEAAIVRQAVQRFIAGESLRSLCLWLDGQGVRTVSGNGWRTTTLRAMLASGRIAGLRRHRGDIIGPAAWPAIITPQDRDRVLARMAEMVGTKRRTPRRYLLSGLLRCGRCTGTLFASPRADTRRYVCLSGPDHGGCGRITVTAVPVEEWLADTVLYRLDTPELADALAGRAAAGERAIEQADALAADRAQMEELTDLYATKRIGATEWLRARRTIEERIRDSERHLSRATRTEALIGLHRGNELRNQWTGLSLTRRAAIVRAVLDHATVGPGASGIQQFDPGRVEPVWRL
jgi:site-specific DNA recombinase